MCFRVIQDYEIFYTFIIIVISFNGLGVFIEFISLFFWAHLKYVLFEPSVLCITFLKWQLKVPCLNVIF